MRKEATREATITECDGGWRIELYRVGYPRNEFVRTTWGEVVEVLTDWSEKKKP